MLASKPQSLVTWSAICAVNDQAFELCDGHATMSLRKACYSDFFILDKLLVVKTDLVAVLETLKPV